MTPDDPRHGTYAGYVAHRKDGENVCDPCAHAGFITGKQTRMRIAHGQRNLIPLGHEAWTILDKHTRTQVAHATGVNREMLYTLHRKGPDGYVHRKTRNRILAATGLFTPIGIQRRLRALAVLGWSAQQLADEIGTHHTTLLDIRRGDAPQFVSHEFAEKIIAVYKRLENTHAPATRGAGLTRSVARRDGWHPPAAWDDLDHDDTPTTGEIRRKPGPPSTTLEDFEDLVALGESEQMAAQRLGVQLETVYEARRRAKERAA